MSPRTWRAVSLILGLASLLLPFAWAYPFGEPFSEAKVAINLSDAHTYSPESKLGTAAWFFAAGVVVILFHSAGSLIMAGGLGYAALVTFAVQGLEPASGFYMALGATLIGFYAFLRTPLSKQEPKPSSVDFSPRLWR